MNKPEHSDAASRRSTTSSHIQEGDSVSKLTRQLIAEARERVAADQRDAASYTPVTRGLLGALLLMVLVSAGASIYGFRMFPDGPIRPAGNGYVSKHGKRCTLDDYRAYQNWIRTIWTLFPSTFVVGVAVGVLRDRDKRRHHVAGKQAR